MSQKALELVEKHGELVVKPRQVPTPGPNDILVEVKAAALNPVDWKIQKYGIFIESFPAILGTDIAGDIVGFGENVTEFKKGDRVFFQGRFVNDYSGFQQYALGVAAAAARIPPNITYDEASTLPVAFSASYVGLYNQTPYGIGLVPPVSAEGKGKYAGNPIVILGGSSSVGQNTIQLARLSGFSPIITTASLHHTKDLEALGATHVVDRNLSGDALASEVNTIANNAPIKYVVDSISTPDTQKIGYDLLVSGGKLVIFLAVAIKKTDDKEVIHVLGVAALPANAKLLETAYHDHLERLLEEGHIKPNRAEVLPNGLAGIPDGLKRLELNQVSRAKLVAHPQETA